MEAVVMVLLVPFLLRGGAGDIRGGGGSASAE
jgi:hypothetical protein